MAKGGGGIVKNIKESVAYLQGLTRGLHINEDEPEGKIILKMLDVLEDIAIHIEDLEATQQDLEDYVVTLDSDLSDVEDEVYEESVHGDDFIEMQCPVCHQEVSFESNILDDRDEIEVTCPHCGNVVYDNIVDGDCVYDVGMDEHESCSNNPGI